MKSNFKYGTLTVETEGRVDTTNLENLIGALDF